MRIRYAIVSDPDISLKTYVIVPKDYADIALERIVKLGFFEPLAEEKKEEVEEVKEYIKLVEECKKIFGSINSFIEKPLTIEIKEVPANTKQVLKKLYTELSNILELLKELSKKRYEYNSRLKELSLMEKYIDYMSRVYYGADSSILDYDGELIVIRTFFGLKNDIESLKRRAGYILGEMDVDEQNVIITAVFDRKIIDDVLREVEQKGIRVFPISKYGYGPLPKVIDSIKVEENGLRNELSTIEAKINDIIASNAYDIALLKILVDIEHSKVELLKTALESKHVTLLSGWTLKSKKDYLIRSLSEIPSQIIFEESPEPPVEFNNLEPFKPFEMFTELNGYPSPKEWDPTPLLTYFYALFFALMFPDIGYAIGLLIGSKYVLPYFVQNPDTLQKLRKIVYVTAGCAMVTGLLSSSFLGSLIGQYLSLVIPPVLPSPPPRLSNLEAAVSFLLSSIKLALLIGYISVLIAHVFAVLKAVIKTRDLWTALLEISMIVFMVFGPPFITYKIPFVGMNIDIFKIGMVIPIDVIEYIVFAAAGLFIFCKIKTSGYIGAFLWIFDVIGILGDVMSFIRIAGIGAGTALLAEIFNGFIYSAIQITSTINIVIGVIIGIIASLMLHIFILGTSVLGPYIHSLRLITYEMATKFYDGSGRRIMPIKVVLGLINLGKRLD